MVLGTLAIEPITDITKIMTAYGIIMLHSGTHSPERAVPSIVSGAKSVSFVLNSLESAPKQEQPT